jgi:DNA mismatch repair protein MutS2
MTRHARTLLEYDRVLEWVAGRAASPLARRWILARTPSEDFDAATAELDRVSDAIRFIQEKPSWSPPAAPELGPSLARLDVDGSTLDPEELYAVARLLEAGRTTLAELARRPDVQPAIARIRARLFELPEIEQRVDRSIDADGEVLDSASSELKRVRSALRGAHQRIVRRLESYMAELDDRVRVPDASVSVREGRYVVPVRREGRSAVGGIVHDESGTGATIFVEPPVAVELMNELRDLERDETREIGRILGELTDRLRPHQPDLRGSLDALVDLDALHARARVALEWEATPPEFAGDDATVIVVRGRHPLLLVNRERAEGGTVVPFDLELEPHERTMVVSGPNTGGKSVFLKAFGLIVLLARAGIVPPVGPGTVLPRIRRVYADIGDEQSIAASLSTFSAHLETLTRIVEEADASSLVLIDEMGTGTDPTEGAALARAILEELTRRGARTIATSHLGALKTLDAEDSGIVNASLEFDSERLSPTYRLIKGRPGRSYGLAIARRRGMADAVMDRAEELVEEGAASLEDLLERLETREREATELVEQLDAEKAEAARLRSEVEERDETLRRRESTAEARARDQAHQLLMNAREEVEAAIAEVKEAGSSLDDETARKARRQVEDAARKQRERARRTAEGREREAAEHVLGELEPGARVRIGEAGTTGHVLEIRDRKVAVEVSGLRMEVPAADLTILPPLDEDERAGGRRARSATAGTGWSGDTPAGSYEIDLRGQRVHEVDLSLRRALDGALLADLHEVRIIHGKGTGAVKARVRELLEDDARVESFRDGRPGEGGSGVTLAVFR